LNGKFKISGNWRFLKNITFFPQKMGKKMDRRIRKTKNKISLALLALYCAYIGFGLLILKGQTQQTKIRISVWTSLLIHNANIDKCAALPALVCGHPCQ
jgi:hypothetical protein